MAIVIKTPQEISQEFLDHLKSLKPNINTDQIDSDWYVKSKVIGGVVSGVYADLNRVSNDAFPQSARNEAVNNHLITWTGAGLRSAQFASGYISVTGTVTGTTVVASTQFIHPATQNVYNSTQEVTTTAYVTNIPITAVVAGASQNLTTGAILNILSPPAGIISTGTIVTPGIAGGTDLETTEEGAARVLLLIRSQKRGATESDYQAWAIAGSDSVKSASVLRFPYGLGTVGLVLASGTTDVDTAVDNDQTIVFAVSAAVATEVKDYVDAINPLTDTVFASSVTEVAYNVSIDVTFLDGDKNTIVSGTGKTQGQLLIREIYRSLYNYNIGGTIIDNSGYGYIYFSDIEEQIDNNLHYINGLKYQTVLYRRITLVNGSSAPKAVVNLSEKVIPGIVTINEV